MTHPVDPPANPADDTEITRIIARPGPKTTPFRVGPPPVAAPAALAPQPAPVPLAPAVVAPPAQVVLPADAVRARPVMTPPGVPARPAAPPEPVARPEVRRVPAPPPVPALSPALPVAPARADGPEAAPAEPVTGWLVVLKGPGRGASLALHGGRNALGSAPDQDLRLAFGDPAIAATGHAYLVYDDETRGFFIEDGKKKDLVRINGQMLTETRPLVSGDDIRIGQTVLRFVAFCGPGFDWAEGDRPVAALPAPSPEPQPDPTAPAAASEGADPGEGI